MPAFVSYVMERITDLIQREYFLLTHQTISNFHDRMTPLCNASSRYTTLFLFSDACVATALEAFLSRAGKQGQG